MTHRLIFISHFSLGAAHGVCIVFVSLSHGLTASASRRPQLSIDIGDEVRGQNTMLSDMVSQQASQVRTSLRCRPDDLCTLMQGSDFDTTGSLLGASMKRVKGMAASGHNRWMCYMVLFILLVFLLLYYIIKWRGS